MERNSETTLWKGKEKQRMAGGRKRRIPCIMNLNLFRFQKKKNAFIDLANKIEERKMLKALKLLLNN